MKIIINIFCVLLCIMLCINISCLADNKIYDENGYLISYYETYIGVNKLSIPSISKQEALEIAKNFISNYATEVADEISVQNVTISHSKSYPYGYNILFPRIINEIEYNANNISIFVDSLTGQVVSYNKNFSSDILIEDIPSIIDNQSAIEKYKLAMGMELQYNKKIVNNKIHAYLTYTGDDLIINANTGNIVTVPYYIPTDGYFDVVNTAAKVSEYIDDGTAITISEANNIIRNIPEIELTIDYSISSVDYLKNHDDTYLITLIYKNANNTKEVTLNAKTGLLAEYSDNSADIATQNSTIVVPENFAEKYYSGYTNNVVKRKNSESDYSVLLYERLVDGIPYKSNGLYVCCKNGKLKKVSFAWDNVEFQPTDNIVSFDYAYQQFFDKCGLELGYYKRDNGVITPVYRKSSKGTGIIDAKTGKQLNYDGSYYYTAKEMNYLDIYSHYSGYYASKLSDCDIYVSSGHVFLKDCITQQEYMLLISEFINGTKPIINTTGILTDDQREMLYAYMYSNGIMDRNETDYNGFVTRADAVKYLLRILGHGTVGEMADIFVPHFSDYEEIPQHLRGYVELARSLGLVGGSVDNMFKPNDYLTYGDSLIIIYNYLKG